MKLVVSSGHFDPLHRGHVKHLRQARMLGDALIVIMNSDHQILAKYGSILQPLPQRAARLLRKCPWVTGIFVSVDGDRMQAETLRLLRPHVFAKGGDRTCNNMPESEIRACADVGCEIRYGVGGQLCSSTKLRERIVKLRESRRKYATV